LDIDRILNMLEKKPKLILTDDGSHTLYNQNIDEHYHSTFGAIQESKHVFIQTGLQYAGHSLKSINLLEIGFGTGLNALLAMLWTIENKTITEYTGIEPLPLSKEMVAKLNYPDILGFDKNLFYRMHFNSHERNMLSKYFSVQLLIGRIQEIKIPSGYFDVVFFDAFSPEVQPEMWTAEVFQKIAVATKRGGVLTTYSSKGTIKRALKSAGFEIEKLAGPRGKREILRAIKN